MLNAIFPQKTYSLFVCRHKGLVKKNSYATNDERRHVQSWFAFPIQILPVVKFIGFWGSLQVCFIYTHVVKLALSACKEIVKIIMLISFYCMLMLCALLLV